jgi:hypothetical protein
VHRREQGRDREITYRQGQRHREGRPEIKGWKDRDNRMDKDKGTKWQRQKGVRKDIETKEQWKDTELVCIETKRLKGRE